MGHVTHCHFEVGELLGVDDSLVDRVRLRQVDHFTGKQVKWMDELCEEFGDKLKPTKAAAKIRARRPIYY